jgi:hypothetical protein
MIYCQFLMESIVAVARSNGILVQEQQQERRRTYLWNLLHILSVPMAVLGAISLGLAIIWILQSLHIIVIDSNTNDSLTSISYITGVCVVLIIVVGSAVICYATCKKQRC